MWMILAGMGIQFRFDPTETRASTLQIARLLEGFGYDQIQCIHEDDSDIVIMAGIKHSGLCSPIDENEPEVTAICHVLGDNICVDYFRLAETERLTYNEAGVMRP